MNYRDYARACVRISFVIVTLCATTAMAEDWPTYRHDNARSGITAEQLVPPLARQWVFTPAHAPEPAWPVPAKERPRVRFDDVYHVAAAGDAVYFGSSADNKVYSLDAKTGTVRWTAFTGGPIRLAPSVWNGRVYVGSDDGYAYCLRSDDGEVAWKVRASHSDSKVLGHGKMISLWPLRTGVLVDDGTAYFGAGVFPHESIFVCAVNAQNGSPIWKNDAMGEIGHSPRFEDFGGISPQGYLLASDKTLFVPSARSTPAAFDRKDGRFLYQGSAYGHVGGTWALLTADQIVAGVDNQRRVYDSERRREEDAGFAWFPGLALVVTEKRSYLLTDLDLRAIDRKAYLSAKEWRRDLIRETDDLGGELSDLRRKRRSLSGEAREATEARIADLRNEVDVLRAQQKKVEEAVIVWQRPHWGYCSLILAGDVLFAGGNVKVIAVDSVTGDELWNANVNGRAGGLAVANGRLFVSTDTGAIYCFGKDNAAADAEVKTAVNRSPYPDDRLTPLYEQAAQKIVDDTGIRKGYCLVYGCGTGRLAFELAKRTELAVLGVDPDAENVRKAREALDAAGMCGSRVTIEQGSLEDLPYSDYFANLVVSETVMLSGRPQGSSAELFRMLKPCGGVAYLGQPVSAAGIVESLDPEQLRVWLRDSGAAAREVTGSGGSWIKITRGPLEGAGKWTHQYADPANTACSDDQLVKGALGTLWFGRPGPEKMVERHARAVAPVAMDGRLFVQGENVVMAYDSYNGVPLWERELPGAVRVRVDSDMGNLALDKDGLCVAAHDECYRLDPATGEIMRTYALPPSADEKPRRWGYLACAGRILFGSTAEPLKQEYGARWAQRTQTAEPVPKDYWRLQQGGGMWHGMLEWPDWGSTMTPQGAVSERIMSSDSFFALEADTGDLLWTHRGHEIAHPAVTIGDATVFLADCSVTAEQKASALKERQELIAKGVWEKGLDIEAEPEVADVRLVVALDAATGKKRWERVIDLTGCGGDRMGMAYHDGVLLFFGCFSNHDAALFRRNELTWRRVTAVSAADGSDLWSRPLNYMRRPVVMGDTLLIEPRACDVRTGEVKTRVHPLTGNEETWEYVRPGHCCSATSASPNMFFLRGYFMWYYDMERDGGMIPFGGIRPGCWINLIPANGLLLFPEASAGCTCSYPVRSTVVMQPKTDYKPWSIFIQHGDMTPVRQMAINFGAPGDRRDDDGTVWFCYPHPTGNSFFRYGVNFRLEEKTLVRDDYFRRNFQGVQIKGTDKPWLYASGCLGLSSCVLPLVGEGEEPGRYTLRLHFVDTDNDAAGQRVFNVKLQGRTVLKNFDIVRDAGGPNVAVVKEFRGIRVKDGLTIELIAKARNPSRTQLPLVNAIEAVRERG